MDKFLSKQEILAKKEAIEQEKKDAKINVAKTIAENLWRKIEKNPIEEAADETYYELTNEADDPLRLEIDRLAKIRGFEKEDYYIHRVNVVGYFTNRLKLK